MFNTEFNVLLIDDDIDILESFQDLLQQEGYHVITCADPIDIVTQIPENWIGVVLCDVLLPNISGLTLLQDIIKYDSQLPVIMISGHGDVPMAVNAVKQGAINFLEKPLSLENLLIQIKQALLQRRNTIENRLWQLKQLNEIFIGQSEWGIANREQLQKLADSNIPVFLYGETGTGRHLSAIYLHKLSDRKYSPLITYECYPQNQINVEVLINRTKKGTLILKNIHHLPYLEQQLLANILNSENPAFRLVIISDLSLLQLIRDKLLITDLYYLFLHTQIELLPLRKRAGDIIPIFCHYAQKSCLRLNKKYVKPHKKILQTLLNQNYRGNIKELIHIAELYAIGLLSEKVSLSTSSSFPLSTNNINPLQEQVNQYEKQIIENALIFYQGKLNEVATYLDIPRKKLYLRMRKHGIDKKNYKIK